MSICGFTLDNFRKLAKENDIHINNIDLDNCKDV